MCRYTRRVPATRATRHGHAKATTREEHVAVMADLYAMLSDPTRLRLLMYMQDHDEVCVTDLAGAAGISESAVSHALRLLRAHGIVDASRDGRWVLYTLVDEHVRVLLRATVEHLERDHR